MAKFRLLFKIKGWILAMVALQALILVYGILVLDFYMLISIILGIFIVLSPIFIVILYKQRERGFKKARWMEPVIFIALVTISITFAYTASQGSRNPDAVVSPGMLVHFENTGDFNAKQYYSVPADQYYYLDFTTTTPTIGLGTNINVSVEFYINIKPANATVEFAWCTDHFQLSPNFTIINDVYYDQSKFNNQSKRINNVMTETWHLSTYIIITKDFNWKPVIMFKFAGGIDHAYLALGSITYIWAEVNSTARLSDDTIIEPGKSGLSTNAIPLQASVSDTFWLITSVMLAIFVICLILSLVTSRFKILVIISLVLTCVSIICMMLLIINEMGASWVDQVPWPLDSLRYLFAVVVAVVKWIISMGLVTVLIIFVTALFGKMGTLTSKNE